MNQEAFARGPITITPVADSGRCDSTPPPTSAHELGVGFPPTQLIGVDPNEEKLVSNKTPQIKHQQGSTVVIDSNNTQFISNEFDEDINEKNKRLANKIKKDKRPPPKSYTYRCTECGRKEKTTIPQSKHSAISFLCGSCIKKVSPKS